MHQLIVEENGYSEQFLFHGQPDLSLIDSDFANDLKARDLLHVPEIVDGCTARTTMIEGVMIIHEIVTPLDDLPC